MPEYRRFVAYFYEYIDGKKQKSAGFAKVELRNGMWRVLFRLTIPMQLKVPARVYGFVREGGYLLGLPLGNMSANGQRAEEWAWRADAPIGFDKYYFGQISGIWIENPDGRTFITVWDDEALEPERFVLEIPEPETGAMEAMPERSDEVLAALTVDIPAPVAAEAPGEAPQGEPLPTAPELPFGPSEEAPDPITPELPLGYPEGDPDPITPELPSEHPEEAPEPITPELPFGHPEGGPDPITPELPSEHPEGEPVPVPQGVPTKQPEGVPGSIPSEVPLERPDEAVQPIPLESPGSEPMETPPGAAPEMPGMSAFVLSDSPQAGSAQKKREKVSAGEFLNLTERENCVEFLLQSRQRFCPFADEEFSDCVQIRMCDLVALQQEGWQVGRSNFLWHGYSQYRHLLLGRYQERGYVLGVPGVFSRQEEYVAGVFDYGKFKLSSLGGCGRRLGYWYRILQETT